MTVPLQKKIIRSENKKTIMVMTMKKAVITKIIITIIRRMRINIRNHMKI